mgnify:CR=1 FL=1
MPTSDDAIVASQETRYLALVPLKILNERGQLPSSIRVRRHEVFSLDGGEGLDVSRLLAQKAIRLMLPGEAYPEPIDSPADKRRALRARRATVRPGQRRTI